jgi:predicted aminopeptidase
MKLIAFLLMVLSFLPSCYVTKQAYRQADLLMSREPVAKVLDSKEVSPSEKDKLRFSQLALDFARDQGLHLGAAYSSYIKVPGRAVSYTVQAARPTEMVLRHWWFPVVGSVPYLGFFDEADRAKEAKSLIEEGYEVHEGSATAFSSLGWFSDPIYSSMLRRPDIELAHLYFHELTHRTLWLSGGVEFNENLAEFVGDTLTTTFFKSLSREKEIAIFEEANADYLLFREWLTNLRSAVEKDLKDSHKLDLAQRVSKKNQVISLAISKKPAFKRVDFVGSGPWNNARILGAGLYTPDTSKFLASWQCFKSKTSDANIGQFLKTLKDHAEKTSNGFEALEAICTTQKEGT